MGVVNAAYRAVTHSETPERLPPHVGGPLFEAHNFMTRSDVVAGA